MKPLLVAVLLLPALAGCLSESKAPGSGLPAPDLPIPATDRFLPHVLVGPGGDAETSLTIGADGTMLACAHGGFRIPSPVWASTDGGVGWQRLAVQPNPVPSGDCDVAVLADGSWVVVFDTVASATVAVSGDEGRTWRVNPLSAVPFGGVDRPWILADGDDILLFWANVMVEEPAIHMFARSTDKGLTWLDARPINVASGSGTYKVIGDPFFDGEVLRVPTYAFPGLDTPGPSAMEFALSRDGGATWTVEAAGPAQEMPIQLPVASAAPDGTLFLSRSVPNGTAADIRLEWSRDGGATWSEPLVVATSVRFPGVQTAWVDARADGTATLAWLHNRAEEPKGWQLAAARVDPGAAEPLLWAGNLSEPVDLEQLYEFIMVRHDADGRAHVLWLTRGDGCDDDPLERRSRQCVYLTSERPAQ